MGVEITLTSNAGYWGMSVHTYAPKTAQLTPAHRSPLQNLSYIREEHPPADAYLSFIFLSLTHISMK
jgi:hypothetical protein